MSNLLEQSYISFCNLDSRPDRLQGMTQELSRIGISAIRQRSFPWQETDYKNPRYRVMYERTPGAIGCHLSQVAVMKKANELGLHALVLEDDVRFCDDFEKRIEYMTEWTKNNKWDIIWLGAAFHVNPPHWHKKGGSSMRPNCSVELGYDAKRIGDKHMIRTFGAYNTFAYLVNSRSISKVLGLLDMYVHESIGIDWLMIKLQPILKCYAFVPGCVYQIDNMSNIGSGMTVWSGHLNNGPYVFQKRMEDFNPDTYNWHECN